MLWSASVLSAPSADTEPTVTITFDTAKYIFNVGENTGRSFMESQHNWKHTKAMFLTSLGTQYASGLAGEWLALPAKYVANRKSRNDHATGGRVISQAGHRGTSWAKALGRQHALVPLSVRSYYTSQQ